MDGCLHQAKNKRSCTAVWGVRNMKLNEIGGCSSTMHAGFIHYALMLCQKVGVNNVYRNLQCRMLLLPLWLHRVPLECCTRTVYAVECCYSHLLPREGCYSHLPPREGLTPPSTPGRFLLVPSTPGRAYSTFYPGKVRHNLLPREGLTQPSTLGRSYTTFYPFFSFFMYS